MASGSTSLTQESSEKLLAAVLKDIEPQGADWQCIEVERHKTDHNKLETVLRFRSRSKGPNRPDAETRIDQIEREICTVLEELGEKVEEEENEDKERSALNRLVERVRMMKATLASMEN